jgi:hypothetical protein
VIVIKFEDYPIPTACPFCNGNVMLTTNDFIYGRKYIKNGNSKCYVCVMCKASVGTHSDGKTPLGRIADRELKDLKMKAHSLFDPIWQRGKMQRSEAYRYLAQKLGISARECHFGWFDKEMLLKAIEILSAKVG